MVVTIARNMHRVLIYGTGAYAQALSHLLLAGGYEVIVHCASARERRRIDYWWSLPTFRNLQRVADRFQVNTDLSQLAAVQFLILAVPAHRVPVVLPSLRAAITSQPVWILVSKGLYDGSLGTADCLVDVVQQVIPATHCAGVVAVYGPSVVSDMLNNCKTVFLLAARDVAIAQRVQPLFEARRCCVRLTSDVCGAEVAFALKNICGIAGGVWSSLPAVTASERCALIGMVYHELVLLLQLWGGQVNTLAEPALIGDFVLAVTSAGSRNFRFGTTLVTNQQLPLETVEGRTSLQVLHQRLVARHQTQLFPIINRLYGVVFAHEPVTTMKLQHLVPK